MKIIQLFIFSLLFTNTVYSQIDTISIIETAYSSGLNMLKSFQKADYDAFLNYTHPKITGMLGGPDKMKEMIQIGIDPNMEITNTSIKKPTKIIVKDSIIQCAIEQVQEFKFKDKAFYTISSLIGISYDLGNKWYFLAVNVPVNMLQIHFPELSNDLKVKKPTDPIPIKK